MCRRSSSQVTTALYPDETHQIQISSFCAPEELHTQELAGLHGKTADQQRRLRPQLQRRPPSRRLLRRHLLAEVMFQKINPNCRETKFA